MLAARNRCAVTSSDRSSASAGSQEPSTHEFSLPRTRNGRRIPVLATWPNWDPSAAQVVNRATAFSSAAAVREPRSGGLPAAVDLTLRSGTARRASAGKSIHGVTPSGISTVPTLRWRRNLVLMALSAGVGTLAAHPGGCRLRAERATVPVDANTVELLRSSCRRASGRRNSCVPVEVACHRHA